MGSPRAGLNVSAQRKISQRIGNWTTLIHPITNHLTHWTVQVPMKKKLNLACRRRKKGWEA